MCCRIAFFCAGGASRPTVISPPTHTENAISGAQIETLPFNKTVKTIAATSRGRSDAKSWPPARKSRGFLSGSQTDFFLASARSFCTTFCQVNAGPIRQKNASAVAPNRVVFSGCRVHTLVRIPAGIFCGVFDAEKPAESDASSVSFLQVRGSVFRAFVRRAGER